MNLLCALLLAALAADPAAERTAYLDAEGVLRWRDDGAEVALFGVNYYAPFALDYEGLAAAGEDHRRTIERDVAHFARLGLDAIRLHVFDRQISDGEGNLLANEHLDLFDYLVAQAKRRGIYTVLTPIAWWPCKPAGNGFSSRYPMPEMITGDEARRAQVNYLRQFLDHRNPYTGRAYKDEAAVVAIELINEPLYAPDTAPAAITEYIDALADAVRSTGARQPIFYNAWQGQEQAVADARIEGATFGWYPTGLVSGRSLHGNYLPLVDDYPAMRTACLARKAKIVYEFDAADVVSRCMYPAMARAFRSGGAQIATQFQYDPLPLAYCNYGWQTHYLNLVYSPGKALSFAIAAEAFRRTPRLAPFGRYPQNTTFGPFRLSYEQDVSVLASDTAFYYSNDTCVRPPAPGRLTRIMGCGSSPLVQYEGTGAYFLDRIAEGVWRLESYPDAVWIDDPHASTSLHREVSRLIPAERSLTVSLPDLGPHFQTRRVAPRSGAPTAAVDGRITIEPGVYVLAREARRVDTPVSDEFYVPPPRSRDAALWWEAPARWRAGYDLPVRATVAAADVREVVFHWHDAGRTERQVDLARVSPYVYSGKLPAGLLSTGTATARIEVRTGSGSRWFPPGAESAGGSLRPAVVCEIAPDTPVPAFTSATAGGFRCIGELLEGSRLRVQADGFGDPPCAAGFRLPAEPPTADGYDTLGVRVRAAAATVTDKIEVGLVQQDGRAYGCDLPLWRDWYDVRVPLRTLRPLWGTPAGQCDPRQLKELSFVFGAWLYGDRREEPHGFELQRVWLEQAARGWQIAVDPAASPVDVFVAGEAAVRLHGQQQRASALVGGGTPGSWALRVSTTGFEPGSSAIHFRQSVPPSVRYWEASLRGCRTLRIVARAAQPATDSVEIVLIENDGAPWGTVIPLTAQWRQIDVPLSDLRFFTHWSHPQSRGQTGDRFHPESVDAVNVCFGSWLYGSEAPLPHAVELQTISLLPGASSQGD